VVASALVVGELFHAGRYPEGDAILARIDPVASAIGSRDPVVGARVHEARTVQTLFRGELEASLRHCEAAVAAYDRAGDVRSACLRQVSVAYLHLEVGDYERAIVVLRDTLGAALRLGLENVAAIARQNLGLALGRTGRVAEGRMFEETAIAALVAQGHRRMEGVSRQYHAIILAAAGELGAAEAEARRAAELLSIVPPGHAYALATLAEILLALGRVAEARAAAARAAEILASLQRIEAGEALIRLVDAETLRATGQPDAAQAVLAAAAERLLARAAMFEDPARRASFLERVPENARTLALSAPPPPSRRPD
jgi:ATP/maltotriose-dependent transcriptional regulator MalT